MASTRGVDSCPGQIQYSSCVQGSKVCCRGGGDKRRWETYIWELDLVLAKSEKVPGKKRAPCLSNFALTNHDRHLVLLPTFDGRRVPQECEKVVDAISISTATLSKIQELT